MKKITIKSNYKKIISDTLTPVSIFLKVRDVYSKVFLLESSDYKGRDNSYSYICFDSVSNISIDENKVLIDFFNRNEQYEINNKRDAKYYLNNYVERFDSNDNKFSFPTNGLFGFISFNSIKYFDKISLSSPKEIKIPDIVYHVFKYVIIINHYKNELFIFEHLYGNDKNSNIKKIKNLITTRPINPFSFRLNGPENISLSDDEFQKLVKMGIKHCKLGDVFQIVLSKRFYQNFKGDEFQVYRALRSINPSPYLFYFDYGSFKIFGSSPEAQLVIKDNSASIFPIAGTFRRTGDDEKDKMLADNLLDDIKENSEHVMLVDLARNDLSKVSNQVIVEKFKEIQYYSHVIHLVSKVSGRVSKNKNIDLISSTFPAGTLSGAPKYTAIELIDNYESVSREFYGGAIGYMGFNGDFNHAIVIRSFLSKNRKLYYQAGAGVVAKSNEKKENDEVYNKVEALRNAIKLAQKL